VQKLYNAGASEKEKNRLRILFLGDEEYSMARM
jgi:hypothetical protein